MNMNLGCYHTKTALVLKDLEVVHRQNNYHHFSVVCSNKKGFPSKKRGSSSLTDH